MNTDMPTIDAPERLTRRVVGFQAFLRGQGFQAGIPEAVDALILAQHVEITDKRRLRAGLQSLLCSGHGEWTRFDDLFDAYWLPPNRTVLLEASGLAGNREKTADVEGAKTRGLLTNSPPA